MDISFESDLKSYTVYPGIGKKRCNHCGKNFNTDANLKNHLITHIVEKPYECSHCGKAFQNKKYLSKHYKIHTGVKPHICKYCGKGYPDRGNLIKHHRVHTGEKPFKCTLCPKAFTVKHTLDYHMNVHTGEKPYKCSYCEKGFAGPHHLKEHERNHTGEKPFKCTQCDKAFVSAAGLKHHLHNHTGVKPFKCNYCDKGFVTKRECQEHEGLHSNTRYKCKQCDKDFAILKYLEQHMRKKHNWKKERAQGVIHSIKTLQEERAIIPEGSITPINASYEVHDVITNITSDLPNAIPIVQTQYNDITPDAIPIQTQYNDITPELPNNINYDVNDMQNANESVIFGMAYSAACMAENAKPESFQRIMDRYFTANKLPLINHPVPDKDILEFYSPKFISVNFDCNSNSVKRNSNGVGS